MTVEERTNQAIQITNIALRKIMDNVEALVFMAGIKGTPEEIENTISDILEYLAKTQPEETEGG